MILLSLVASALAIVAASSVDRLPLEPLSPGPIRVLSSTYEIHFPDEIVVTLQAEAEADITEITLFYRLGRQHVRVYGYPEFEAATQVSADFAISTGGASYVPSGADIEYYFVLRDAEGNSLESERFSLEYLDPRFEWQRFEQGDLVVLSHDRSSDRIVEVATSVNQQLIEVRELLGLDDTPPMKAVIVNSMREAGRSFPVVSEAARRGHVFGGFAFGELDLFVLVGLDRDGMVHEMTHLLVDEKLASPLARVPAWLNEGLAMYFESSSTSRETAISRAARNDSLIPLRWMGSVPGIAGDIGLFYAQSSSLVNYMMDEYGTERMAGLLAAINEGDPIQRALPRAYGLSLEELESEWKTQVTGSTSLAPVVVPGSAGTSILIGGAVLIAVFAVAFRWLRHLWIRPEEVDPDV